MWQWLKSNIIKPVGNFFSDIFTSVRTFFTGENQRRDQYQPILSESPRQVAPAQLSVQNQMSAQLTNQQRIANSQPSNDVDIPHDIFNHAMPEAGVSERDITVVMSKLSACNLFYQNSFKDALPMRMLKVLLQSVVDDDREMVKKILNGMPELLLMNPPANLVIESQHTWQKFYAESALKMAAKRKQIEMIKIMMPYLDKLEQTDEVAQAKAAVLTAWNPQDPIAIPHEYANYVQSLIDVFTAETFPNGVPGENGLPMNTKLSEKTELALSSLFNLLLPKKAVKLDDYLDPELFLLTLYKAYVDKFASFQNWNQRDAFCIRTIGLAQSVLSPATAKIFCEGLYYVVEENRKISDRAASLKLFGGESFYRSSRESLSSLGFEHFCAGGGARVWRRAVETRSIERGSARFGKIISNKNFKLTELMLPRRTQTTGCVIS